MAKSLLRLVALLLALGLVAAACGDDDADAPAEEPAATETEPAAEPEPETAEEPEPAAEPEPAEVPAEEPAAEPEPAEEPEPAAEPEPTEEPEPAAEPEADEPLRVAFFGFAAANGFAQATWAGIQEGAAAIGAEVEFFDPVFDANTQISQIQDAITVGNWDAFVIQANDGNAVIPVIEEALAAGIPVVGEFTPIGMDFTTIEPQIDGLIFVGAAPVDNGVILAEMAIEACAGISPCNVAYLEGFRFLPLDVARTNAFHSTIKAADGVELIASVEGGYLPDTGLGAAQDVFVAHGDVHVMVGSSQAIMGAEQAANDAGVSVKLIGNGGARQAVDAVREGRWHGVFLDAERDAGRTAFELAVQAATGGDPPRSFDSTTLVPNVKGTADVIGDFEGQWDI